MLEYCDRFTGKRIGSLPISESTYQLVTRSKVVPQDTAETLQQTHEETSPERETRQKREQED
jgi:hypothetical protein